MLETARTAAETALATAKAALPEGLDVAQTAYNAAKAALDEAGVGNLGDDEILVRNSDTVAGTIGYISISNKVTQLSARTINDITDGFDVNITAPRSGIVAATEFGAVNGGGNQVESNRGILVGGADTTLDDDELLVYIV